MSNFGMVGKFITDAKDRDALLEILIAAADEMSARDDCQLYAVSKDADDETVIWVMELWDSKAAHDQTLTLPEVREAISKAMPLIKGMDGASLIPVSGK